MGANAVGVLVDLGAGNDEVYSKAGGTVFGGDGDDTIDGSGYLTRIEGGGGNDWLVGTKASPTPDNSSILGGAGEDTLGGGFGTILRGGSESDTFLFSHVNLAADADSSDYLSWNDVINLYGGIKWGEGSESPWAYNTLLPVFRYAGNIGGEMVVENWVTGTQFFIANWQGGPGVVDPTAHVQVQEINLGSSRLLDFDHTKESLIKNLGDVLTALFQQMFGKPFPDADPIVLDLDGDGLELAAPVFTSPYFDIDEDQFAERTGWVMPDDGFLAHDANGNGTVDGIAELFGSYTTDGFTELTALDSNADGVHRCSRCRVFKPAHLARPRWS